MVLQSVFYTGYVVSSSIYEGYVARLNDSRLFLYLFIQSLCLDNLSLERWVHCAKQGNEWLDSAILYYAFKSDRKGDTLILSSHDNTFTS